MTMKPSARGKGSVWAALGMVASLTACATTPSSPPAGGPRTAAGTMAPYKVNGVWYRPHAQPDYDETGVATWYGAQYHNRRTADGEIFDMDRASAAHTTLPLPCLVDVTNLENGRRIRLRVNDRGPFVRGRILDVSPEAARRLGFYQAGSARVRVRYAGPAPTSGGGSVDTTAYEATAPMASNPAAEAAPARVASPGGLEYRVRVQAGAFADRGNAERAAASLRGTGEVTIEPLDRAGLRLWRVTVAAPPAAGGGGEALRDQVRAAGFPDAKIISRTPSA